VRESQSFVAPKWKNGVFAAEVVAIQRKVAFHHNDNE